MAPLCSSAHRTVSAWSRVQTPLVLARRARPVRDSVGRASAGSPLSPKSTGVGKEVGSSLRCRNLRESKGSRGWPKPIDAPTAASSVKTPGTRPRNSPPSRQRAQASCVAARKVSAAAPGSLIG